MTKRCCVAAITALLLSVTTAAAWNLPDGRAVKLAGAAAEPDAAKRAAAVRPFVDAGDPALCAAACAVWVRCGKAALPVLREVITDEARPDRYSFLTTLVRAGGKDAVPELERLLRDEQVYWHNLGMNLDEAQKVSRPRFDFVVDLLTHLHALGYRDDAGVVRALRDQFRDHPLLDDYGATPDAGSPVAAAADAILQRR